MKKDFYALYVLCRLQSSSKKGEESLECKLQKLLENKVTHLKVVFVFLFEGKEFFELKRRVKNFYGFKSVYFTKPLFSSKKQLKNLHGFFLKNTI